MQGSVVERHLKSHFIHYWMLFFFFAAQKYSSVSVHVPVQYTVIINYYDNSTLLGICTIAREEKTDEDYHQQKKNHIFKSQCAFSCCLMRELRKWLGFVSKCSQLR